MFQARNIMIEQQIQKKRLNQYKKQKTLVNVRLNKMTLM